MMPERIWAGYIRYSTDWTSRPIEKANQTEYIRADVVNRMIADEREACAQIAQNLVDNAGLDTRGMREAIINGRNDG